MWPFVAEWIGSLLRWLHVIAGMAWIGSSFYFMHIDASLKPAPDIPKGKGGEVFEVHGGGFYQVRKWLVAPENLPPQLIWHKWEAYTTWTSGFALLCWIYYGSSDLYLIDPAVRDLGPWAAAAIGIAALALGWVLYDRLCKSKLGENEVALGAVGFVVILLLAWLFQQVFSGRGAMVHTGAVMATWMAGNVAMIIIPNQRKVIAALLAGQEPDPALGRAGKTRSTHNNYLTLPVVFLMLASHSPLVWTTSWAWAIVGLIVIAGAVIRVFYNVRHRGGGNPWWCWGVAAACIVAAFLVSMVTAPGWRDRTGLAGAKPPATEEVLNLVMGRCSMCHAREPLWPGLASAPKGILLDTPEQVMRHAAAIEAQAVRTHAMPPNNITLMEPEERRLLAAWLATR